MKKILLGCVAAVAFGGAALAADGMAGFYGNTLVAKHADGSVSKVWYNADKTYSEVDGKGAKMSGTWAVADGKLCQMQKSPTPAASKEKMCGAAPDGKKVGDSWDVTADDGTKYSLNIVAGTK